ncbi:hypothetical protein B0H13DRAFT_1855740 [Mycena leptocephala]|nr:hypothetical protein B0H13DRAFT_1855740 [Mycena leptocephala]
MSRRIEQATSPSLLNSGAFNQSLLLLGQIGEAGNLAVLKGAWLHRESIEVSCFAGITASGNQSEARALAQDVGQLAMAVAGQVEELKDDIGADTELLDQISKLCLDLEAVHSALKNLFKRDSFTWFVKHSRDEVKLQRLQRDIKHAIDLFSFQSSLRLQRNVSRSGKLDAARKGRILDEITEVCQTVMEEIKAGKQAQGPPSKAIGPVLPRIPRHFYGREEPIDAAVTTLIAPTPGRVAILGAAGIGKTAVSSMVLFDLRVVECFGDRQEDLDALGDPEHRSLIVLDNFESPWESSAASKKEVESFLASLCALDTLAVAITMRGSERPARVQWSRPILPQLGPLDVPSARKAFLALSDCLEDDPWIDPSSLDISIGISLNSPRMKAVPEALTLLSLISLLPDGVDNTQLASFFQALANHAGHCLCYGKHPSHIMTGTPNARAFTYSRTHDAVPSVGHRAPCFCVTYYMGLAGLSSDLGGPHGQLIVKRLTPEIGNLHSVVNLTLDPTEESPTIQPLLRGAITAAINLSKFIRYTHLGNPETVRLASIAANKLGDAVLRADTLYHLAFNTLTIGTSGQDSDHERLCREALALYEENGNVNGQAECTWLLGQIYKATKRQKECKVLYEQALKLAVESQNAYCQAKSLSCLSEITFYSGDVKAAEDLSQQALTLFRELENLTNIGMTLYMLGIVAAFRSDRKADVLFEESGVFLAKAGAHRQACLPFLGKGDCASARCDFYTAREAYVKAINILQETGFLQSGYAAHAQLLLGEAAARLYDYPEANRWLDAAWRDLALSEERFGEAVTFYQRALHAAETLGFAEKEAQCRVRLGTLELLRGRPWVGVRSLFVAAARQRQINDVKGLSETFVRLGECFAADGDKSTTLLFFRTAYPVCRKIEALRNVAACLVGLGTVCGNKEQVTEGAALYKQTGDTKEHERCKLLLGGTYVG